MRKIRYFFEYLIAYVLFYTFNALPYHLASNLGGFIARNVLTHTGRSCVARKNIQRAIPDATPQYEDQIIKSMWDNIGRNFAELPHITKFSNADLNKIVSINGEEYIHSQEQHGMGALYFTAHISNWEIVPKLFSELGCPVNIVYRQANNPGIEKLIQKARSTYVINTLPKGATGSRLIIEQLKSGHSVGMLVDQKMNDGIGVNFFGHKAMTAPAIARLAIKYHCPVIPVKVTRFDKHKFKVTVYSPLELPNTNNRDSDIILLMKNINQILEKWIREDPGQWIWMHNRWS